MGEHFLFNEDLISWSVGWQEIIAADPAMRFHAVFCDPPYGLEFMGKAFDTFRDSTIDPSFLNWFAGFTDGEGCFSIHKKPSNTFDCQFTISLRADDRPILERIHRTLAIGTLSRPSAHSKEGQNPQTRFCVSSQGDCLRLREIFRHFPLRAKKSRDFEIWSDALDAWVNHERGEWSDMAEYREALMSSRSYESGGVHIDPYQVSVTRWGKSILPLLYPGAIVLMFGGTRTSHRLAVGMEEAGFELWDTCMWMYGSGFPKGQDISKLIDKRNGDEREVVGYGDGGLHHKATVTNLSKWDVDHDRQQPLTAPATEESASWSGHKTPALKPAYEPVLCFRAPAGGKTYAELAMEYGSGAINVDGCRIGAEVRFNPAAHNKRTLLGVNGGCGYSEDGTGTLVAGRYPANLILDQTSAALLDEQSGNRGGGFGTENRGESKGRYGSFSGATKGKQVGFGDSGGASRFFYTSKASKSEREAGLDELPTKAFAYSNGAKAAIARGEEYEAAEMGVNKVKQRKNTHPTVKPLSLCKYLATLILPPDCVQPRRLLIPFAGTASEMIGALQAGWDEVYGIEREQEYIEIAEHRVEYWSNKLIESKE